jgi:hypothetical protein
LIVGTVAWAAASKSKENRIKRVSFMGLTRKSSAAASGNARGCGLNVLSHLKSG